MKIIQEIILLTTDTEECRYLPQKPDFKKVCKTIPILYPTWDSLRRWNDAKKTERRNQEWARFKEEYWQRLVSLGADTIISRLDDGDVLLCWCSKYEYCHRSLVAEFLRRNGIEVEEI